MLRYKTETRPGLGALYDIQPGNGVGPFLQPRSPHGATTRDDGGTGDDNRNSVKMSKAPVKSPPLAYQQSVLTGRMSFLVPTDGAKARKARFSL